MFNHSCGTSLKPASLVLFKPWTTQACMHARGLPTSSNQGIHLDNVHTAHAASCSSPDAQNPARCIDWPVHRSMCLRCFLVPPAAAHACLACMCPYACSCSCVPAIEQQQQSACMASNSRRPVNYKEWYRRVRAAALHTKGDHLEGWKA